YRAFGGFALAAIVGTVLGMLMGRSTFAAALLDPLFSGTYAVPKLALFPIFIFVFGLGSLSKVALIFLECLYPMTIITYHGARSVHRVLLWSAQNMGASRARTFARVVLPATLPYVFAALRVALPVALIVAIITEMISSVDGLGYLVTYSLSSLKTDRMLALVVVISLLGLALDRALVSLRTRLVYWEKLDTYYVRGVSDETHALCRRRARVRRRRARAQGVDMKVVASICLEAAGSQWFSTTYMVKDDGPIKSAKDLKGGTVGVVGYKTATDLWARAGLLNAGLLPDKDAKVFSLGFPAMGDSVRTNKIQAGTFVEPFYSAEVSKGGLRKLFTAVEAIGYEHELLDVWFGEKFLKAHPEVVRAFLADYVAVTKYYL